MANFSEFRPFGQKNFSAYLSGKHQNLFCPTASKFRKIISKAYFAKGLMFPVKLFDGFYKTFY